MELIEDHTRNITLDVAADLLSNKNIFVLEMNGAGRYLIEAPLNDERIRLVMEMPGEDTDLKVIKTASELAEMKWSVNHTTMVPADGGYCCVKSTRNKLYGCTLTGKHKDEVVVNGVVLLAPESLPDVFEFMEEEFGLFA